MQRSSGPMSVVSCIPTLSNGEVLIMNNFLPHKSELTLSFLATAEPRFSFCRPTPPDLNATEKGGARSNLLCAASKRARARSTQAIVEFQRSVPAGGLSPTHSTAAGLDRKIVAVSPSSSYRLQRRGLLGCWRRKPSFKDTAFVQRLLPHEHWHIDISRINISRILDLGALVDGCSHAIVRWKCARP